ncbi:MAG: antibiotic biosynthesis monooxygenase [Acidimicrobiales bacterium]
MRPDRLADFERWENDINTAVARFDGYLGAEVFPPRGGDDFEYVTVIHFDTPEHLEDWENSEECHGWLAAAEDFIERTETRTAQGIELWFSLPRRQGTGHPPLWKSVLVSSVAVYALLLGLDEVLAPLIDGLPDRLSLAISVLVLSALLTWPVLPYLTRTLSGWLYSTGEVKDRR